MEQQLPEEWETALMQEKMQDKKYRVSFFEKKFLTNLERGFTIAQVRQEDLRRAAVSLWWCRILKVKENVE
jgi:hypothetical protein